MRRILPENASGWVAEVRPRDSTVQATKVPAEARVIDVGAALLSATGQWRTWESLHTEPNRERVWWFNNTARETAQAGSSLTFHFFGTGIWCVSRQGDDNVMRF